MSFREKDFLERRRIEEEPSYEDRVVRFRDVFLSFLREQGSVVSETLELSENQQKAVDFLMETEGKDLHCFLKTILYSSTGEKMLNCGYNTVGKITTNTLLTVRLFIEKDCPAAVLILCRASGHQDGQLQFLFSENNAEEEMVRKELAYDRRSNIVLEERHYKNVGKICFEGVDYSVFGFNCIK